MSGREAARSLVTGRNAKATDQRAGGGSGQRSYGHRLGRGRQRTGAHRRVGRQIDAPDVISELRRRKPV